MKKYFLIALLVLSFGVNTTNVYAHPEDKKESCEKYHIEDAMNLVMAGSVLYLSKFTFEAALLTKSAIGACTLTVIALGQAALAGVIVAAWPGTDHGDTFTAEENMLWTSVELGEKIYALNQSPENLILKEDALNMLLISAKAGKHLIENAHSDIDQKQELIQKIESDIQLLTGEYAKTRKEVNQLSEKAREEFIKDHLRVYETMRQDNIREKIIEKNTTLFESLKQEASKQQA